MIRFRKLMMTCVSGNSLGYLIAKRGQVYWNTTSEADEQAVKTFVRSGLHQELRLRKFICNIFGLKGWIG